jgi:beta-mannanase
MQYRTQVIALLEQALNKLAEVQPKNTASANRLKEGKEKVRAAKAKVAEEPEDEPAPPPPPPPPPPSNQIYVGALIREGVNGSSVPWNETYWTKFEEMSGCEMSIIHFGMEWGHWYATTLAKCAAKGAIPCMSLSPPGSLSEVLAGNQDTALAQMKKEITAYRKPLFIRLMWEMNGNWYKWGRSAEFIAAWRYIHDKLNAPNVSWAYCPNIIWDSTGDSYIKSMYPGDAYVDWVGMDGYNWGANPYKGDHWKTPVEVYDKTYASLRELAPTKPILIGETASTEYGGSKATWITELLKALPEKYPAIKALIYFNWEIEENGGVMDWPVTTSASSLAAWKAGLSSYFRAIPNANTLDEKPKVP